MTGQLKHDGKATSGGVSAPAGEAIQFGDLYRINNWTGFALKTIGEDDTLRDLDLEIASDRVWYVKLPAGVNAGVGDILWWAAAGFQRGDTDLVVAGTAGAVVAACKVDEAKDANGYAAVRALNVG